MPAEPQKGMQGFMGGSGRDLKDQCATPHSGVGRPNVAKIPSSLVEGPALCDNSLYGKVSAAGVGEEGD